MVITQKMLEELRKIFIQASLTVESEDELARSGLAIARLVLLKEMDRINKGKS